MPFDCSISLIELTLNKIKLQLAHEEAEAAKSKSSERAAHDVGPSGFVSLGLEIEDAQYVLFLSILALTRAYATLSGIVSRRSAAAMRNSISSRSVRSEIDARRSKRRSNASDSFYQHTSLTTSRHSLPSLKKDRNLRKMCYFTSPPRSPSRFELIHVPHP